VYILNYVDASSGVVAWFEEKFQPIRQALGLGRNVDFGALIADAGLVIEHIEGVNILGMCRLIKCRKKGR
ncbi:MAG: hypothetical protein V3W51_06125, partial [Candidatus Brocadiales bacterium]